MSQRQQQVARQMGIDINGIEQILYTDYDRFKRQKSIFFVNIIRDHIIRLYRVQDNVNYKSPSPDIEYQYDKRLANTIVSALAYRFDDKSDDDDYSKWSDEELFMVMNKSLKLPNFLIRHDRLRNQLIAIIPSGLEPPSIVNPLGARYIFDDEHRNRPKTEWDDLFNELYPKVFTDYEGMYMLQMGNWDNKSLLIALVLFGIDYDITTSNFADDKIMLNIPLTVFTQRKNPFMRTEKPVMLHLMAKRRIKYHDYKTKTPLSVFKTRYIHEYTKRR